MTITLKEVTTLSDLKTFIRFPVRLYQGNSLTMSRPCSQMNSTPCAATEILPLNIAKRATGWRIKTVILLGAWPPFSTASTSKNGDKSICVSDG